MPKTRNHFKIGINLSRDNTIIKSIDVHEVESIALSNEQQMSLKKQVGIQQEIASFMQNQTMRLMDWSAGPSASSGTVTRVFRLYGKSTGWLAFLCAFLRQCSGCTQCFGKLSNRALRQAQQPCGGGWWGYKM